MFYGEDVTAWMSALQPQQNTPSFATAYTSPFALHSVHSSSSGSPSTSAKVDPYSTHSMQSTGEFSYNSANTSVGLPHVHYDVTAQLQVQGKTPQVSDIILHHLNSIS